MIIELHSLSTHDFFTISTHKHDQRDYDCRKITQSSRIRLWKLIDNGLYIGHNAWWINS